MRLAVDHRTTYRFAEPQARLTQLLRLTPNGTDGQTVLDWRLHVDCDARLRHGRDGFGNATTMLYVDGPISSIEIEVIGEVLTASSAGQLSGGREPLPPPVFLRATALIPTDPYIAGFAAEAVDRLDDVGARMHRLTERIAERFAATDPLSAPDRPASEAFTLATVTIRDRAQILIAALRSVAIPARYVSGYRLVGGAASHATAPHGWVEAHDPATGWCALDPTAGGVADQGYVRVTVALDSAGAAPVAGSRLGEGTETLDVDVSVRPED